MDIAMMWFDDGKRALREKVLRAAGYYAGKYGVRPDVCLVNPLTPLPGPAPVCLEAGEGWQVKVDVYGPVLPGHLWVGVEEE